MKRVAIAIGLLLLVAVAVAVAQTPRTTATPTTARYQLLAADVQAGNTTVRDATIMKIDTQTGRTWLYFNHPSPDGKVWIHGWTELPELQPWQNPPPGPPSR